MVSPEHTLKSVTAQAVTPQAVTAEAGVLGADNLELRSWPLWRALARSRGLWLILIFLTAFGLRLAANARFEGLNEGPSLSGFGADGVEFNAIASNLVTRHEYARDPGRPTSFRAPGFPFALAGVYLVFGANNYLAARIFFCIIGALLAIVLFFVARIIIGERGALLAAALAAIYPNLVYYNIHFASEPLYTLLLCASVWALLRAVETRSPGLYGLSGGLLALAALTRPAALLFFPIFGGAILWLVLKPVRRELKPAVLRIALFCGAAALTIAPWTARNYLVHDRFLVVASNGGSTLWGSNNEIVLGDPALHGTWITTETMAEQKANVQQLTNEVDRDRMESELGKQFLRTHLGDLPRLVWYKLREFWTPVSATPNARFNRIMELSYGPMLPLMLLGFWFFVRRYPAAQVTILMAPIAGTVLSSLVFYGSARFRCTIEPMLLVFAALALKELLPNYLKLRPSR
jgi:4-amino-4-deoxy-L-arabinose transferase-like glycosyltransferase